MQKVLIISTHFAPDIHVGAKRITKFAKYLPSYGWQPFILTKEVCEYHGVDNSLYQQLPPNQVICRVREWRLSENYNSSYIVKTQGVKQNKTLHLAFRKCLQKAVKLFLFYDFSWLLPAFLAARRLIRENDIHVIYSSVPNPEAHMVALLLKLTMPVKWVCEYRDPWTRQPVTFYPPVSPLQPQIEWTLEGWILKKADRLVFVGPKYRDRVLEKRPLHLASKSVILYNGYDEDDFAGLSCNTTNNKPFFTIGHVGTFGRWVMPQPFLKALGQVIRRRPELRSYIRVRFIGEVKYDPAMKEQIQEIIQIEGLQEVIILEPFLPHRDSLNQMMQCDCLLLLRNCLPEDPQYSKLAVTAKLFEYLRAQRPILALVPPEGDLARLINEHRAGIVVATENVEEVSQAIIYMYDSFCRGEQISNVKLSEISKYERKKQTGKLATIFNDLLVNAISGKKRRRSVPLC